MLPFSLEKVNIIVTGVVVFCRPLPQFCIHVAFWHFGDNGNICTIISHITKNKNAIYPAKLIWGKMVFFQKCPNPGLPVLLLKRVFAHLAWREHILRFGSVTHRKPAGPWSGDYPNTSLAPFCARSVPFSRHTDFSKIYKIMLYMLYFSVRM